MDKPEKLDISYMGPIFKKYRLDAKRTQDEVAEKVGITTRFSFNRCRSVYKAGCSSAYILEKYPLRFTAFLIRPEGQTPDGFFMLFHLWSRSMNLPS